MLPILMISLSLKDKVMHLFGFDTAPARGPFSQLHVVLSTLRAKTFKSGTSGETPYTWRVTNLPDGV